MSLFKNGMFEHENANEMILSNILRAYNERLLVFDATSGVNI